MAAKFSEFDEYQLAKYNKRSKLKNPSKIKVNDYIYNPKFMYLFGIKYVI